MTEAKETVLPMPIPDPAAAAAELREQRKLLEMLTAPALVVLLNFVALALAATIFQQPLFAAKFLLLEVTVVAAVVCLAICFFSGTIVAKLAEAEQLAYYLRDDAMFELQHAQLQLRNIHERLSATEQEPAHIREQMASMLQHAAPLAMMLFQRERSVIKWGMFGLKVAKEAFDLFKKRGT